MTNLISRREVNGHELVYIPKYVPRDDPMFEWDDREVFDLFLPALQKIVPDLSPSDIVAWFVRRARIVQPLQVIGYSGRAPQPTFDSGPISVVNNAQLLQTDLHNSMVVRHARAAVQSIVRADEVAEQACDTR